MTDTAAAPSADTPAPAPAPVPVPEHPHPPTLIAPVPAVPGKQQWGRVLICGGTNWLSLGKKGLPADPLSPDLPAPHTLRSLSNVKATGVYTSHSGCHAIVIDVSGAAYLFGRNSSSSLGLPASQHPSVSGQTPRRLLPTSLGAPQGTKFTHAACGRNHSVLVGDDGSVWTAGVNAHGQCGHPAGGEVGAFKLIQGGWARGKLREKAVFASAGVTFTLVLTESGRVYAFGSGEHGQLGNGRTGERIAQANKTTYDIEDEPILVKGPLDGKKVVQIACGQQHAIALTMDGLCYVWGFNGYCRLGLGHQKDVLTPTLVPQFAGANEMTRGAFVAAGPTATIVIDRQRMLLMAGKFKTSGAGSVGQPFTTFRYFAEIQGCKMLLAAAGGVTHFATAEDDDSPTGAAGIMTIAWGQNAINSELGLGEGQPKSTPKPVRVETLNGVDVIGLAAGQNTSFFLARPNEALAELPRFPEAVPAPNLCVVCDEDREASGEEALECEKCDTPYHLGCLDPPLQAIPEGQWFCPKCEKEFAEVPVVVVGLAAKKGVGKEGKEEGEPKKRGRPAKRKAEDNDEPEAKKVKVAKK
ncbi:RCC1/BLIP-II protein [Calocera cornea HHB12733]|uniref:RCC1/BLIP-II protein n=1 Tax=Calocera cornea HHB12733 TaxID=1353952 RepID=A0A165HB20_9BASI|nr:RCC1/BLIP-II protein [Calocera cornea HHB12733]